jgi:hypothetical protein
MAESIYQKRMKVRRMSDIERLAQQYSKDVRAMGSQYQTSFADYQKQVSAQMAPYESALEKYKVDMSAYQSQAAAYQQRLDSYQKALQDFPTSEGTKVGVSRTGGKQGSVFNIDGAIYSVNAELPVNYYSKPVYETKYQQVRHSTGLQPYQALVRHDLYKKTPPEKFTEEAPRAPSAPTKPEIAEFDQSDFEAKSKELGQTYQRELGERKSARLAAVSRSSRRPLLQGS